jgi:hypothetical protein
MNSMAPEKEFAMANVNARSAKGTNGRPCGDAGKIHSPPRTLSSTKETPYTFLLGTRVVNTTNYETLVDFCACRLECFKHFSSLLFETERVENATTVHIE